MSGFRHYGTYLMSGFSQTLWDVPCVWFFRQKGDVPCVLLFKRHKTMGTVLFVLLHPPLVLFKRHTRQWGRFSLSCCILPPSCSGGTQPRQDKENRPHCLVASTDLSPDTRYVPYCLVFQTQGTSHNVCIPICSQYSIAFLAMTPRSNGCLIFFISVT